MLFRLKVLLYICYLFILLGPSQDDVVEEQNERLAEELAGKVSRLKSVSAVMLLCDYIIHMPIMFLDIFLLTQFLIFF